jgi:hypothetical protein
MHKHAASVRLVDAVVFGVCFGAISTSFPAHAEPIERPVKVSETIQECGARSLFVLLALGGSPCKVEYSELVNELDGNGSGSTFGEIANVACRRGVDLGLSYVQRESLHSLALPAIVHMWLSPDRKQDGHYVVLLRVEDASVTFVETRVATAVRKMSKSRFLQLFSGYALTKQRPAWRWARLGTGLLLAGAYGITLVMLRSDNRRSARALVVWCLLLFTSGCGGDRLSAPPYSGPALPRSPLVAVDKWHEVGLILAGSQVSSVFTVSNPTLKSLQLKVVHASCGCVHASIAEPSLGPGGSTTVVVEIDSSATLRPGPLLEEIHVVAEGVGVEDNRLILGTRATVQGWLPNNFVVRVPSCIDGWQPPHLRGELCFESASSRDDKVELIGVDWAAESSPGGLILGTPMLECPKDHGNHSRQRLEIPLVCRSNVRPMTGEYGVAIDYRIGEAKYLQILPLRVVDALE